MNTSRMEAFSDAVIAVAITLLSLELAVPDLRGHSLAHGLGQEWPRYAAYAVSFLTIGIIWINHHAALARLRTADHQILVMNLLLLMSIGVIPFATDLVARYLTDPAQAHVAAAVYCGVMGWMGFSFVALNWFILMRRAHYLEPAMPLQLRRRTLAQGAVGTVPYVFGFGLAFISAYAALALCALLAVYYALPIASGAVRDDGTRE